MKPIFKIIILCCSLSVTGVAQKKVQVIAHRGFWQSKGAAQNSIASLENADEIKAFGAEFDIHLTADSILVINHDKTIQGLSIQDTTYSALRNVKLSNGEKLSTAREYLEAAKRTCHIRLIAELKPHATPERDRYAAAELVALVREKRLQNRTDYITFSLEAGKELVRLAPEADVYYLNGDLPPAELKAMGFAGLDYHFDVMRKNPTWFDEAHRLGLGINVWTINDSTTIREMVDFGADFITTDKPDDVIKMYMK